MTNIHFPRIRTIFITIIAICIIVLSAYWAKCQAGLNLSTSISLHNYFPFKYLTKSDVIKHPETGIVIDEAIEVREGDIFDLGGCIRQQNRRVHASLGI